MQQRDSIIKMESDRLKTPLEEFEPEFTLSLEDYRPFIGSNRVEDLKRLAEPLEGIGWAHVNSTFMGGGVAEMLRSIIPLARSLGIRASWYAIRGHDEFFKVTKKFHNMLQGLDHKITLEEIFGAYLDNIDENAKNTYIASDMVVVHDPQPAALVLNGVIFGNVLWRCHIDTSNPNQTIWKFLLPYINHCAGAIFTMPEFVGRGLQIPIYQIMPCIDPLAEKNKLFTDQEAMDILEPLFNEHNVDPGRPIIAAVSRYDIHKNQATILHAFAKLKEQNTFKVPPYLIFLGNTATDDPEGEAMLKILQGTAGDDPDVRFWVNVENNDQVVGALMRKAAAFVHVSTREGFGLVVSEALWQGTPVIGSRVGGITQQVLEDQTGFLVDPMDVDTIAGRMSELLEHPDKAEALGTRAREHVRDNFLLPEIVRRYLTLLRFYTGVDRELPEFRMNGLSYSEVIGVLRSKHLERDFPSIPKRAS